MILLTRKLADSQELAKRLAENGFDCFIEPLFSVDPYASKAALEKFDGIIITSRNALEAIQNIYGKKIFVVGKRTAKIAHELGSNQIIIANSSAEHLAKLVKEHCSEGDKLYYPRGDVIAYDLCKSLAEYDICEEIVYTTKYKSEISNDLKEALRVGKISQAIFYSQKAVDHFIDLLGQELKNTIPAIKFIVPLNCRVPNLVNKVSKFIADDFTSLLKAIEE